MKLTHYTLVLLGEGGWEPNGPVEESMEYVLRACDKDDLRLSLFIELKFKKIQPVIMCIELTASVGG